MVNELPGITVRLNGMGVARGGSPGPFGIIARGIRRGTAGGPPGPRRLAGSGTSAYPPRRVGKLIFVLAGPRSVRVYPITVSNVPGSGPSGPAQTGNQFPRVRVCQ